LSYSLSIQNENGNNKRQSENLAELPPRVKTFWTSTFWKPYVTYSKYAIKVQYPFLLTRLLRGSALAGDIEVQRRQSSSDSGANENEMNFSGLQK
jgi:hypothetical protein